MKKTFCDVCGNEIKENNSDKIEGEHIFTNRASFCLTLVTSEDICLHCIIDKIDNLDDRPRRA